MKFKIKNKKKFIVRILEILIIVATIILTLLAINYATEVRGYSSIGGEYLIPIGGSFIILVIETIYEEKKKKSMNIRDYLLDEMKRLNRRNDILEKNINKNEFTSLGVEEAIQKNALAMCEIAKVCN